MSERREFLATIDRLDRLEAELRDAEHVSPFHINDLSDAVEAVKRRDRIRADLAGQSSTVARRVYADWLEENGEAEHAEFIRVGWELEGLPEPEYKTIGAIVPDHADYEWGRCAKCAASTEKCRYHQLSAREAELLAVPALMRWAKDHYLPLGTAHHGPMTACQWDRGLVVGITCGAMFAASHAPAVSLYHPLRTLRLTSWEGIDRSLPPDPANALPWLRRLELPRSAENGSGIGALRGCVFDRQAGWVGPEYLSNLFGRNPDGTPRVTVVLWNDATAFRATFPPDAEPVVVPPV